MEGLLIPLWRWQWGELSPERELISFSIKKPHKNLVVQHGQAATRGQRQPGQGLSSLPHSLPAFPGRMEHLQVPPAPDPLLLTGEHSCSFPALLAVGIGRLESGKERKDLDSCEGWSGERPGMFCYVWVFQCVMAAGIAVRNFPVTLAPKLLRCEKTPCPLFPAFSTRAFLLFFPSEINRSLSRVSGSSCTSCNLPCTYLPPQRACQPVLGQNKELQRDGSSKVCFCRCV